jgi:hypothetical protein
LNLNKHPVSGSGADAAGPFGKCPQRRDRRFAGAGTACRLPEKAQRFPKGSPFSVSFPPFLHATEKGQPEAESPLVYMVKQSFLPSPSSLSASSVIGRPKTDLLIPVADELIRPQIRRFHTRQHDKLRAAAFLTGFRDFPCVPMVYRITKNDGLFH